MNCNKTAQAIPVDSTSTEAPIAHILPVAGPHPPTPPKHNSDSSQMDSDDGNPVEIGVIAVIALEETTPPMDSDSQSSTTAAPIHH